MLQRVHNRRWERAGVRIPSINSRIEPLNRSRRGNEADAVDIRLLTSAATNGRFMGRVGGASVLASRITGGSWGSGAQVTGGHGLYSAYSTSNTQFDTHAI